MQGLVDPSKNFALSLRASVTVTEGVGSCAQSVAQGSKQTAFFIHSPAQIFEQRSRSLTRQVLLWVLEDSKINMIQSLCQRQSNENYKCISNRVRSTMFIGH